MNKNGEHFKIWRLEQLINFGTDGKKIHARDLRKFWKHLTLDPDKKRFMGFLLWGKKFLTKNN